MNYGYIINKGKNKVVVVTDGLRETKVVDYNSNIDQILINENLLETLDNKIESCEKTGEYLYNQYHKYFKMQKQSKKVLSTILVISGLSLVVPHIFNIPAISFLSTIFLSFTGATILTTYAINMLKKLMHSEVEKNAFKLELLNKKKDKIIKENSLLYEESNRDITEVNGNHIIEVKDKNPIYELNEEINKELNSLYPTSRNKVKRKIRVKK